jgi:xylulose-5-phosphate/fructose-6-phosphate phosphoketolase
MRSYKPEELFDQKGRLIPELADLTPKGDRRMGANPHANGGLLLHDLKMPTFMTTRCMWPLPAPSSKSPTASGTRGK